LEIEYFKIPIDTEKRAARNLQQGATIVDKFCEKSIPLINEAISRFISEVKIQYTSNGQYAYCEPFTNYENGQWYQEFVKQGYALLNNEKIVNAMEKRLKKHFPPIKVKAQISGGTAYLVISDFFDINALADSLE
ncbi:13987_t:CDS:1, partial [Racocetra fulgida]